MTIRVHTVPHGSGYLGHQVLLGSEFWDPPPLYAVLPKEGSSGSGMMSAKRGMGPSGWAPRRTHAVGTTSSSTRDPKRALVSSALRSFLGGRPGGQMRGVRLGVPTDARRGPGCWTKNKKEKRAGEETRAAQQPRIKQQLCVSFLLAKSSRGISGTKLAMRSASRAKRWRVRERENTRLSAQK